MTTAKANSTTKHHYAAHTSSSYESAFFYSVGDYTSHLRDLVLSTLNLKIHENIHSNEDSSTSNTWESVKENSNVFLDSISKTNDRVRIMDIGGGTGNFTKMMLEQCSNNIDAVVIDPFLTPSETDENPIISQTIASDVDDMQPSNICFVKAGAEDFIIPPTSPNIESHSE